MARWQTGSAAWPSMWVSSTLEDPKWNNTTVLSGDQVTEVSKLKQEVSGEIVVAASFQLVRTLLGHHIVDEMRLMVCPVVLGGRVGDRGGASNRLLPNNR